MAANIRSVATGLVFVTRESGQSGITGDDYAVHDSEEVTIA
jgi:hypothetical protein